MATGIQTGMRTGTAPTPTGARGGAPAGGGSPIQKILQTLQAMSPKHKLIAGIALAVVIVAAVSFSLYSKSTEFVNLYEATLTETDVRQISERLTSLGIQYKTDEGAKNILVSPATRSKVRMQLAQYGLPLRHINVPEAAGVTPQTPDKLREDQRMQLEADMSESVRQIEGVADAYVKIVLPKDDFFATDKKPATVAVMLRLQPNVSLTQGQIKGIVNLMAYSVEGIDAAKGITVVDTQGMTLYPTGNEDVNNPNVRVSQQNEAQNRVEQQLKENVQRLLDKAIGPDKYTVAINATLDTSDKVTEKEIYGGADNTSGVVAAKTKLDTEKYSADPGSKKDGEATPMSFKGSSGDTNSNYEKTSKTEINQVNSIKIRTQTPAGDIKRITASVLVDNLKPDQVEKIQGMVENAIGFNAERGDQVKVASMPFSVQSDVFKNMQKDMANRATAPAVSTASAQKMTPTAVIAILALLLIVGLVYILRQNGVQIDKSRLMLAGSSSATSSDISDLVSDKIGRSTLPADTKINTSEQLEQLAKEKPTKVAELLKSTWLADKER
jgi:flagellar M-ring protein FliF